jgi:hypothetical protein
VEAQAYDFCAVLVTYEQTNFGDKARAILAKTETP